MSDPILMAVMIIVFIAAGALAWDAHRRFNDE